VQVPRIIQQLMRRRIVLVSALVLLAITILALGAPWFASFDPNDTKVLNRLKPPSAENLLGTDELGRDLYSRIVHGARFSLAIGALTALGAVIAGTCLGLVAGYFRRLDAPLMRIVDAMMSFPDILLAIALVAILGPTLTNVVLALTLVYTPRVARVVRASTLVVREMLFIEAVRALGVRTSRILWRHVLPNLLSPVMVQVSFIFAHAIMAEAGLSFLGVGVPPDIPTWGTMVAAGQQYAHQAFWVVLFPGLGIVFTALTLQLLGDGVRDLLDPRLKKTL
jgi:peptide/nickel transport system permease protein